jgi:hypothetical protein
MESSLWPKSLLALSVALILAACGTTTDASDASVAPIVPGETECDNPGDVSPDGKYVCAGRGAFYWLPLQAQASPSQSMEERYRECVDLKNQLRITYTEILQSLLRDDNELWAWFALTNSIKESRRNYLSQDSINLINEYRDFFDDYQILQCELNFPILKDQVPESDDQQAERWTPSAIV